MLDGRFRIRADTGCTADSRDSGIDVRSRNIRVPHDDDDRDVLFKEDDLEEKWDVHTFLWIIVFSMTMWCFRLPMSIWFSTKVDWSIAVVSLAFFTIFGSCGLCMYIKHRSTLHWHVRSPYIFTVAWIAFGCGVVSFSASTWSLFGWWSLYIAGVTLMFFVSISPLFP